MDYRARASGAGNVAWSDQQVAGNRLSDGPPGRSDLGSQNTQNLERHQRLALHQCNKLVSRNEGNYRARFGRRRERIGLVAQNARQPKK